MEQEKGGMSTASGQRKYLGVTGAWALAFGCSVGWGSFVMPGTTFLPVAGPVGTAIGLGLGGLVMLLLAVNYHYLMNRFPDGGGTYTYTKKTFGYDQGFLSAWFLILTYIAIIWANATALPLIARTLLGDTFRFGYLYEIAGYPIYFGELLLSLGALVLAAMVCLFRKAAVGSQIVFAVLLFTGIVICFVAAAGRPEARDFTPAYAPEKGSLSGIFTIFTLAPWAYVGFESISHSAAEAKFSMKKTFRILAAAVITGAIAYILLSLLAVTAVPEGNASWTEYVGNLDQYKGVTSQPTFNAAYTAMGDTGSVILGVAALGAIFTGLIGNYIALSRLMDSLSADGLFPKWIGGKKKDFVPRNAILCILLISAIFPFFGRTAISWIVDVTTVGATIAYALASASAWKAARVENNRKYQIFGVVGVIISLMFALAFLIPNLISVTTLSTESYMILAIWSICGFLYFRFFLRRDRERRMGKTIMAWVVLLGLIIFTSSVWMHQTGDQALEQYQEKVREYYEKHEAEAPGSPVDTEYLQKEMDFVDHSIHVASMIQIGLIVVSLLILLNIYGFMQKREKMVEVEKARAEESSRAKSSFLSNMSHEIRTPMNAIIGLQNIALRDPELKPRTREHLEKIGSSANHLLGLINDILDMSRIESGRMTLKKEEFSFREFLNQINIIINGQCQDKKLHYECNIVGHVADYYVGDDLKLKQVLINILGNSVKFTNAPGDVTLTVEQLGTKNDPCTMRFIVQDTGIGMDEEFIPKLFETFSQEDATNTNKYGGSGLGMAITRNLVEMMGGAIHVESKKGAGSKFTVTVQLAVSDRKPHEEQGISLPAGIRAMVVDDDEISCEHIRIVLNKIGVEAETCTDAEKALATLRQAHERKEDYPLLLTDYKMPKINGLELSLAARELAGEKMGILMLTGHNWDFIEEEAKTDGVDAILSKPLFADILLREIHSILKKRGILEEDDPASSEEELSDDRIEEVLAGKRILMAEDVDQNAEILADLLDLEEVLSARARNGEDAVSMFRQSEPGFYSAILMDVRMPVMDGLDATRMIRSMDRPDAKTIPIVAMTANVFDEDVERSMEAGMNAHLSKPVEPDKLYVTMARLIIERGLEVDPSESQ